jgi:YidC/Oxa1 family membrane protein insertase
MQSMAVMQRLQPQIREIQDKWKKRDPKKMQQMIMDLYKENNANPMAGCLPLLIQMPILIALFRALYSFPYINEDHATFLWLMSLSDRDPYYLMPILAAATTYFQSKMTMSTADPTQRMMLYMMPLLIGWISSTVPAGMALYWVMFNIVGIVQQYQINKSITPLREGATGK